MKKTKLLNKTTAILGLVLGAGLGLGMLFTGCAFMPDSGKNSLEWNGLSLVWEENFNTQITSSDWNWDTRGAGKCDNNEVQGYSDNASTYSVCSAASDGSTDGYSLKINAISSNGSSWTSARISTQGKHAWKYGYFEARIKMPVAYDGSGNVIDNKGVWPAFWLMPDQSVYGVWPRSGEIDVMEYSPSKSGESTYATLHHAKGKTDSTDTYPSMGSKTFSDPYEWHTYGVLWKSGGIEMYYDGESLGTFYANTGNWWQYPYDQDFYIILNLAMGGNLGGSINSNMRKAVYEIDYVRVYQ